MPGPSPHAESSPRVAALAILLPSVVSIWSLAGPWLNADTILYSVMSHEKVTLFYWGQNRLANLVPALLWPVRDPDWNLLAVLLVHSLAWHSLLWLVARVVQPQPGPRDHSLPTYALLTAATHLLLTPEARYVLIAEGQPYALSYLALGLGWSALLLPVLTRAKLAMAGVLLAAGIGLNPSLALAAGALALATAGATRQWQRPALGLAVAAVLTIAWQGAGRALAAEVGGHDYLAWHSGNQKAHLLQALGNLAAASRQPWLMSALVFAGLLLPWVPASRGKVTPLARWLSAGMAVLAGGWLLLFSSHAWVILNQLHFKYFFPVLLAAVWAMALLLAHALPCALQLQIPRVTRRLAPAGAAVLLLACPAVGGEARWTLQQFGAVAKALGVLKLLPAQHGPLLVGGDYWQVWPLVHQFLQRGVQAYGTAERGSALASEISSLLHFHGDAKALGYLCVGRPVPSCLADLEQLTTRPWQLLHQQPCGDSCLLLQVASPQRAWLCPSQLTFAAGGNVPQWATSGLGEAEAHGRWTVLPTARLSCQWPDAKPPRAIRLTASAFLPVGVVRQRLYVGLPAPTGQPVGEWSADKPAQSIDIALERRADGQVALQVQLPDAVAPSQLGLSGDGRALALSLQSGQWLW